MEMDFPIRKSWMLVPIQMIRIASLQTSFGCLRSTFSTETPLMHPIISGWKFEWRIRGHRPEWTFGWFSWLCRCKCLKNQSPFVGLDDSSYVDGAGSIQQPSWRNILDWKPPIVPANALFYSPHQPFVFGNVVQVNFANAVSRHRNHEGS